MRIHPDRTSHIIPLIIGIAATFLIIGCKEQTIKKFTLSNGLKIFFKRHNSEVVACNLYLKGGVSLTAGDKAGLEAVLLTALSRASKKYDRRTMERLRDDLHFTVSIEAEFDYSTYKLHCLRKDFKRTLDIFLDSFLNPRLSDEDIEEARQTLITEVQRELNDPLERLFKVTNQVSFAGHPYAYQGRGTVTSLQSIVIQEVRDFYQKWWISRRMFAVVIGDLDQSELQHYLETTLAIIPDRPYNKLKFPSLENYLEPTFRGFELEGMSNFMIRSNFSSVPIGHSDFTAAILSGRILSDLMSTTLRTWNGVVYSAFVIGTRTYQVPYGSYIITGCSDLTRTIQLTRECVDYLANGVGKLGYRAADGTIITDPSLQTPDKLVQTPLEEVLPAYKNMFITSFFYDVMSSQAQADYLAQCELAGLDLDKADLILDQITRVSPEQIKKIAQTYFQENVFWAYGSDAANIKTVNDASLSEIWQRQ